MDMQSIILSSLRKGNGESLGSSRGSGTIWNALSLLGKACGSLSLIFLVLSAIRPEPALAYLEEGRVNWETEFNEREPSIAMDGDGTVWVAWIRETEQGSGLWYTRWLGDVWAYEEELFPEGMGGAGKGWPRLAAGGEGGPHVIWSEYTNGYLQLYYSRWTGEDWQTTEQVTTDNNNRYAPDLAISSSGTPWIVWNQWDAQTGLFDIYYTRRTEDGWRDPGPVETDSDIVDWDAAIACGEDGAVWVVWHRYMDAGDQDICYSRWTGLSWTPTGYITSSVDEYEQLPRVVMSSDGAPWSVWQTSHFGEATRRIQSATWNGTGWEPGGQVSDLESMLNLAPDICIDPDGNPWVAWWTSSSDIYVSGLDGVEWGANRQATIPDSLVDYAPKVASDASGNIWIVWEGGPYYDGYDNNIYFGRLDPSGVDAGSDNRASRIVLGTPFPNPCRSGVWLPLQVGESVSIRASVYNASGQRVRTLAPSAINPGSHGSITRSIFWDRSDDVGRSVRAGIYMMRIEDGGLGASRRVVVLP